MSPVFPVLTTPEALQLSLGCDLGELKAGIQAVKALLVEQGWGEPDVHSVELALVEAGNNVVNHTHPQEKLLSIELEVISEPGQVEFRLADNSQGFDWPAAIDLPPEDHERGRGLYLITRLMDYAEYLRGRDGNVLVMRKLRSPMLATNEAARDS